MKCSINNLKNDLAVALKKCRRNVGLVAGLLVFALTVYTLIPKDEKLNEVDGEKLAEAFATSNAG